MALDHLLLHGVQGAVGSSHVFHAEQGLAVERGQEADAGVDGFQRQAAGVIELAQHHGAGTAVAFGAAFLGAGAVRVFTQPLQYGARGAGGLDLDHRTLVEEADRPERGIWVHGGAERGKTRT